MHLQKYAKEQIKRLKIMGWVFICLAVIVSAGTFLIPTSEASYWLSAKGKEGFYVLSGLMAFFGFYCLGATWRRQYFI